jgi:hypothetical protein
VKFRSNRVRHVRLPQLMVEVDGFPDDSLREGL